MVRGSSSATATDFDVRVPIGSSDSILAPVPRIDNTSRDRDAHAYNKLHPLSGKKNLCSSYSLHVERLKLLSAFCALHSPGFSDEVIDNLRSSQSPTHAVTVPWSVQRCELKWLLCILISAPLNSMRNLSQLIQRISPSLELTTKLRLPWHTAGHANSRKLQLNNRYSSETDSNELAQHECHTTRITMNSVVCPLRAVRIRRDIVCLMEIQQQQQLLLLLTCDEDRDRKTYAAVAAAAAVSTTNPVSTDPQSSWLTPAEAARYKDVNNTVNGKRHHPTHKSRGGSGNSSSSSERSPCGHTQSDDDLLPLPSVGHASAVGPKVSVVSARTTKEPLGGSRSNLSFRTPSWIVNNTSYSRRGSYLARPIPTHPRVSNAHPFRSPFHSATPDLNCPAYPFSYQNSYAYPSACDYFPHKTKSYDECCLDDVFIENVSHESACSSTDPLSGVFVDLTGYDVTVSVERLPPITDGPGQLRGSNRRFASSDTQMKPLSSHLCSTPTGYPTVHEQNVATDYPGHPVGFTTGDCRQRPAFQRQISCPEDPLSVPRGDNNCSIITTDHATTTKRLSLRYNSKLNNVPFFATQTPQGNAVGGWVYVPEPIRVPRSQDVYNALRTCLVPHYELRDYATSAPPPRQWRRLEEPSKDGFAFTLMCYNLLCPSYATQNMYPYCPSWALNWDYRRRAILDEIRVYHANIICLQEVETNQFEEIFKPELAKLKYDAVFLPKSRCRTMDMKDGKKVDGCAIFWQVDKFEKLHEFHHEFMFSCSNMCENPSPLIVNRVMTRDNVALGVIFETKGAPGPDGPGGRQFCVTTGHIHWDPELSDVKMIQTILWTAELWAYIDQFLTGSGDVKDRGSPSNTRNTPLSNRVPVPGPSSPAANMPVILCGDLNSLPESGVVEFLMRGSLPKSHTDFLNNGFKYMFEDWRLLEKWAVDGDTLRHRFTFDRAYRESQGMQLTNFTYEFKGMIDYVLFSRQHFRLLGSLDQIHESWFIEKKIVGCPHVHIPSDHFALLVELELEPTPQLASLVAARSSARSRCRSEGGVGLENGQSKSGPPRGGGGSSLGCSPHSTGAVTPNNLDGRTEVGGDSANGSSGGTGKHRKR
ncbi:unnamed protein product [Echinostoma caproni]|uniref:Endo/exonuclease/phosphatase domain-containing protein n=1 Tax=Echinostoma caproni TaxID=27848 RepID=A0A183AF73_9TREM|nr:unnamed protein product [Echinostoma caproni]